MFGNRHTIACLVSFSVAGHALYAAPGTSLPQEWSAPMEQSDYIALADKETGQIRFLSFDSGGIASALGPFQSQVQKIDFLTTGVAASNGESIAVASASGNGISLVESGSGRATRLMDIAPGPSAFLPLQRGNEFDQTALTISLYGENGSVFDLRGNLEVDPVSLRSQDLPLSSSAAISYRDFDTDARYGLAVTRANGQPWQLNSFNQTSANNFAFQGSLGVSSEEAQLCGEVIGDDQRQLVLEYEIGSPVVILHTLAHGNFSAQRVVTEFTSFPIGSISQISPNSISGVDNGILITSADGSQAAYAEIKSGNSIKVAQTFSPEEGKLINGLVMAPGYGIVALEGNGDRRSTKFASYAFDGDQFQLEATGVLPALQSTTDQFATLFWFSDSPFTGTNAQLVELETRADWTSKNGINPLPSSVTPAVYTSSPDGLTLRPSENVQPPAGANFLITSQVDDTLSLASSGADVEILTPALDISPSSGTFSQPIEVSARFDSNSHRLFMRRAGAGSSWAEFQPFTTAYTDTWLFYAENKTTGLQGPIVSRTFSFNTADLTDFDSDRDGVPDYVEEAAGLDPAGGADSDGDFQSDLEELLAVPPTDPSDPDSNTAAALRNAPSSQDGFDIIAQAFATPTEPAFATNSSVTGELISVHSMLSHQQAASTVVSLTAPSSLIGQTGAPLSVPTPLSENRWIFINTAPVFSVNRQGSPVLDAPELIRTQLRPTNPAVDIILPTGLPTGTDLQLDSAAWISAARAAYGSYQAVSEITRLAPAELAVSALAECVVHDALLTLTPQQRTDLGVPADVKDFSLFKWRDVDIARVGLSEDMLTALENSGFDLPAMIELIRADVLGDAGLIALADAIYARYRSVSGSTPLMATPLAAFRSIVSDGTIADPPVAGGQSNRLNPYRTIPSSTLTSAASALTTIRTDALNLQRPTAVWQLFIASSTSPDRNYDYRYDENSSAALDTSDPVVSLIDRFRDPVKIEQGLGLPLGSVFEVRGYTDVPDVNGQPTLEFISLVSAIVPTPSDTDADGDLLDDSWERFFFGSVALVTGSDAHPVTGLAYSSYHANGLDPRSGTAVDTPRSALPSDVEFVWNEGASTYDVCFSMPDIIADDFNYKLTSSRTLEFFTDPAHLGELQRKAPGRYALRARPQDSANDVNFWQIGISLK